MTYLPSLVPFPATCGPSSALSTTLINPRAMGSSSRKVPVASASAADSLRYPPGVHYCHGQTMWRKRPEAWEPGCLSLNPSLPLPDCVVLEQVIHLPVTPLPYQWSEPETRTCLSRLVLRLNRLMYLVLYMAIHGFLFASPCDARYRCRQTVGISHTRFCFLNINNECVFSCT